MEINEITKAVKLQLKPKRYAHTLRVAETAVKLAELYDVPKEDAEIAGLLHDYAKNRPIAELEGFIKNSSLPQDLLEYHHELWHGPVGSLLIEADLGITNINIQEAVHYHTTGRAHMTQLELIIYVADYIEPGRDFKGLDEVREVAERDLLEAAWMISRNSMQYLLNRDVQIYPDALHAYNDLTKRFNGGN